MWHIQLPQFYENFKISCGMKHKQYSSQFTEKEFKVWVYMAVNVRSAIFGI